MGKLKIMTSDLEKMVEKSIKTGSAWGELALSLSPLLCNKDLLFLW